MQVIDFSELLEADNIEALLPPAVYRTESLYRTNEGVQFRSKYGGNEVVREIVRVEDQVLLIASAYSPQAEQSHRQIVQGSDWLHFEVRLKGVGSECVRKGEKLPIPEKSCVVSRYLKNSSIDRRVEPTSAWRAVCLVASPGGLARLLGIRPAELPPEARWLLSNNELQSRTDILALEPKVAQVSNDVLTCSLLGELRRPYLKAKSLELASIVLHAVLKCGSTGSPLGVRLSRGDVEMLALARNLMVQHLESQLTLAQLAQQVGLNRTKLALGFKRVYGMSAQAFWRDLRLHRARELLRDGDQRITDVAMSVGYAELSSFTRAFSRKFGVLPRECRGDGQGVAALCEPAVG